MRTLLIFSLLGLISCSGQKIVGPEDGVTIAGESYRAHATAHTEKKLLLINFTFYNNTKIPVPFDYQNVKLTDKNGIIIEALDPRWVAKMAASNTPRRTPEYIAPEPSYVTQTYGSVNGYQSGNYFYGTGQATTYSYETSDSHLARAMAPGAHNLGAAMGAKLAEMIKGKKKSPDEYLNQALRPQLIDPGTGIEGVMYYMKPDDNRFPIKLIVGDDTEKIQVPIG